MGPEGDAFHELDIYVDYVVGLKEEDLRSSTLIECYRRFSDHVEEQIKLGKSDSLVSDTSVTCVLLCPVLKWSGQTALSASGKDLLAQVERAIDLVDEALRRGFQPDLLEFQNTLIFCYFVVAEVVQIGLNVYALTSHLQVHRFISAGRWAATPPRIRMQYGAVILRFMLYFYRPEEAFRTQLGFSINALADLRSVFEDAAGSSVDAPFTSHQWVFRWFKDKLDTEIFSSQRRTATPSSLSVLSDGEQMMAVELSRRFGNYRTSVTVNHLERFLLQFGTTQRIRGMLRLLTHLKFYPLWELAGSIEKQLTAKLASSRASQLMISPFGDQTGSTAIINYLGSHSALARQLQFAQDLPTALASTKDGDSIYFIDDCLLSGTQTLNILGDLTGTRKRKAHHTAHCQELSSESKSKFLRRSLSFVYCVATDIGEKRFREGIASTGIDQDRATLAYSVLEHSTSKAFEPMGPVGWASAEEREDLCCRRPKTEPLIEAVPI